LIVSLRKYAVNWGAEATPRATAHRTKGEMPPEPDFRESTT